MATYCDKEFGCGGGVRGMRNSIFVFYVRSRLILDVHQVKARRSCSVMEKLGGGGEEVKEGGYEKFEA